MNGIERLQAAIDKLETLKQESSDGPWVAHHPFSYSWITGMQSKVADRVRKPDAELIVTLHRTIDAQLAILRNELDDMEFENRPPFHDIVALADALLGGAL